MSCSWSGKYDLICHFKGLSHSKLFIEKPCKCVKVKENDNERHMAYKYRPSGGRLNKKDGLTRYGDSHVKDKTS